MAAHEHYGGLVSLGAEIPGTGIELTPVSIFFIIAFVVLVRLEDLIYYIRHDRGED